MPGRSGEAGVVKVIADQKADLIGTQEGLYHQLTFMDKELPDHKWIGVGREGGQRGEFMAIFYRSARFEPLETNHFWLSDTPEKIGSASWGNTVKRMVTWVRFLDRRTKKSFISGTRTGSPVTAIAREIGPTDSAASERFEGPATSHPRGRLQRGRKGQPRLYHAYLRGCFHDSFQVAKEKVNAGWNTFNGFGQTQRGNRRIDWVLTRGPVLVDRTKLCSSKTSPKFPVTINPSPPACA